jgi:hypothetical protein
MLILIVTLGIDNAILKIYDLVSKTFIPEQEKILLFAVNSSLSLLLVFLTLNYLEASFKKNPLNKKFNLELLYRFALNSLFVIGTLIALLIFQQFNNSYYNISISIFIISISYGTATAFLVKLILLFISWWKSNPNWILSLFITSMLLITFNLAITAIVTVIKLGDRSDEIRQFLGGSADISAGKYVFLNNVYTVTTLTSFVSFWITTAILITYYRERLVSSLTYWVLLVIPLVYFLLNYIYPFILSTLFSGSLALDPVTVSIYLTTILALSKPIGGLTFAIAFWKISSNLSYEKNIKTYMIVCGWGVFLIFSANQAGTQTLAPYPPFGLVTTSTLILGSFMMLLGVYNSAVLVGNNNKLRTSIRQYALESSLLGAVGTSQMNKEIAQTVKKITRLKYQLETDEELPIDFDESGLKEYLSRLVVEVKKEKDKKKMDNNTH